MEVINVTLNANELRIGNWVYDAFGKPMKITSYDIYYLTNESRGDSYTTASNPIPTTPEILKKCGFKGNDIELGDGMFLIKEEGNIFCIDNKDGIAQTYWPIKIDYLHQLQNVIFVLTGTELQINLTEK